MSVCAIEETVLPTGLKTSGLRVYSSYVKPDTCNIYFFLFFLPFYTFLSILLLVLLFSVFCMRDLLTVMSVLPDKIINRISLYINIYIYIYIYIYLWRISLQYLASHIKCYDMNVSSGSCSIGVS